jgi:hypothetical protein
MKTIQLIEGETYKSRQVLADVVRLTPQGVDIEDMRRRLKVLDAIEAAQGDDLTLEDAQFDLLKTCFITFRFGIVHKELIAIADTLK